MGRLTKEQIVKRRKKKLKEREERENRKRRKEKKINIKKTEETFVSKEFEEKRKQGKLIFDDLPRFLKKHILSFLASTENLKNLSLVSRSW